MVRGCWLHLHKSMRVVNLLVNVFGVAMIVYSLWLLKKWKLGESQLPYLPKPWFIHACLGVGICVCLSTLFTHMVVASTNSILVCSFILVICLLLVLEIAVSDLIFFKINWVTELSNYIDEYHKEFERFVIFNISICRLIVIIALVPQIYVVLLALILRGVGTLPRNNDNSYLNIHDNGHSFLEGPNSPIPGISRHNRNIFLINSPTRNSGQSFQPFIIGVFRICFPTRAREIVG